MHGRSERAPDGVGGKGSLISGLLPLLCLCPFSFFTTGKEGKEKEAEICLAGRRKGEREEEEEEENGERQKPINMQMRKDDDDVMNEALARPSHNKTNGRCSPGRWMSGMGVKRSRNLGPVSSRFSASE